MPNAILENINTAYEKGLDALGLDKDQIRTKVGQLQEKRAKLEASVQASVTEQVKELQGIEVRVLNRLEEAVGGFKNVIESNYGRLSGSLDKLEKRIADLEKTLSTRINSLPIESYDALNADEIVRKIDHLKGTDLGAIRRYEIDHKGRVTVLKAIDARLAA